MVIPRARRMKSRLVRRERVEAALALDDDVARLGRDRVDDLRAPRPFTNAVESTTPLRIPYGWSESSPKPAANVIGAWTIVAPAARAASIRARVLSSMSVRSITSWTAPWSAPPSEVKSFWYSIRTTAVLGGIDGHAAAPLVRRSQASVPVRSARWPRASTRCSRSPGHEVRLSNPAKVYFPKPGWTKLDLVEYYLTIADAVLVHLRERPTVMKRFVNGIMEDPIWQKRVPQKVPDWLQTATVAFPSGRTAEELVANDEAHLAGR